MGKRARLKIKSNKIYKKYAASYKGRYLFYFGGAGSGKSIDGIQRFLGRMISEEDANHKFLFVRKVAATIKDSIWDDTKQILSNWGLLSLCDLNKVEKSILYRPNGNRIIMKGIDDPEKIKSISGVTSILIEEVTELEELDFKQLDLRLRMPEEFKYRQQIVAMFNPIADTHWLVKYVEPQKLEKLPVGIKGVRQIETNVWEFDRETKDDETGEIEKLTTRVINTNYKHNRFLPSAYITQLRTLSQVSENYSTIYEHGRWGQIDVGDRLLHNFREVAHVRQNIERDETLPIHYSVDFNVTPYMSGLVFQIKRVEGGFWQGFNDYTEVRVLDEIANEHPRNTAYHLGEELEMRFDTSLGLFLYGDASGLNRLGVKDTKTHFEGVKKGLRRVPIERIPKQNPRYNAIAPKSLGRVDFLNLIFSGLIPLRVVINKKCKNFINDLKLCTKDKNGLMDKKQRDGHHLDAFTYFVCHKKTFASMSKIKYHDR